MNNMIFPADCILYLCAEIDGTEYYIGEEILSQLIGHFIQIIRINKNLKPLFDLVYHHRLHSLIAAATVQRDMPSLPALSIPAPAHAHRG